ncbi:archaellin/type IV pilin N-terminal domain-containing protein [Thermoproteota archaeon]
MKKIMKKKGISPVLASIILLAVTVAVGVGVASYVFGLFGSYTEAAAVSASGSPTLNSPATTFNVTLVNSGAQSDSVLSISTVVNGTRYSAVIDSAIAVAGGGGSLDLDSTFAGAAFVSGSSYQVRISFQSGSQLSLQSIAS